MWRLALPLWAVAVSATVPVMPKEYSAVMKLSMPYIGLQMPMRILTSGKAQKIEYYDGLQVDVSNPNGTTKYVFENGRRACLFSPSTPGPKAGSRLESALNDDWSPTVFFPSDLTQYELAGEGLVGGIMCQKYTLSVVHGTKGTMDDHVTFYWDAVLQKPVRGHMHARAEPWGSHTDEYILDVLSYQSGAPADDELTVPASCGKQSRKAEVSIQIGGLFAAMHRPSSKSSADVTLFDAFLRQHGKSYAPAERAVRRSIWEKNVKLVKDLNRHHDGATIFKGNQFLDMTKEEVLRFRGGKSKSVPRDQRRKHEDRHLVGVHESSSDAPPKNFDWRSARPGVVGPVKDQGMCGSCWAFGAIGPIESTIAIQSGKPYQELPEQVIVDCTWTNCTTDAGCNQGCDGGNSDVGVLEIVKNFGGVIPTAAAYGTYLSINGYCKDQRLMDLGAKVTGWVDINSGNTSDLKDAIATKGPIAVSIMVPDEMLFYDSGVLKVDSCKRDPSQIDHSVVATGYGTDENGNDYWTIRNSWSTYWGDQGYINIARGGDDCCVACEAGYANVATATATATVVV